MEYSEHRHRADWSKPYLAAVCASGAGLLGWALAHWQSNDPRRFLIYLAIAMFGSGMKVALPSLNGTMSANFVFVLIGVASFSLPETLLMGCLGITIQTIWQSRNRLNPVRISFNTASIAVAASAAYGLYHLILGRYQQVEMPVGLLFAAAAFFAANTLSIAGAIALTERRPWWPLWKEGYLWSFPVYLLGAVVAALIDGVNRWIGWQTGLLILPVLYFIHNSHRLYVEKLEAASDFAKRERQHAVDKAAIQLRTIEALALAIEAKDGTTHEHLERVQAYALGVGEDLGLSENEMEALRAAAILHDVGKIAVPEYIISKPGKLTPAEFEKMKIHPVVGAQILEQVQFPYPVAPMVRGHHEKWDGTGYPDGLKGEQIPIGARILTAVDVLDALSSDRQYRKAMPLADAMAMLQRDAGKMFDPKVVEVLSRRYVELEQVARQRILNSRPVIQTDVRVERGAAPDAGFEAGAQGSADLRRLHRGIAGDAAPSRCRSIECEQFAERVRAQIEFDALGLYLEEAETLRNVYSHGASAAAIERLAIPVGKGLVGWVAENHMPIVNGNPAVEPGLMERAEGAALSSALAAPVESANGTMLVVCLYRRDRDAFQREHLKILQSLVSGVQGQTLLETAS